MRLAPIAIAAALVASSASAQTAPPTRSVGQAVSNTLKHNVQKSYPQHDESWVASAVQAIQDANSSLYNTTCGSGRTWACMMLYLEVPTPIALAKGMRDNGDGSFGGGGATGSWDDPEQDACATHRWDLDPQGNLIVPTLKLKGGGPMRYLVSGDYTPTWSARIGGTSFTPVKGDSDEAASLRSIHNWNMTRAKEAWVGFYRYTNGTTNGQPTKTFTGGSVAYYNGATLVGRTGQSSNASYWGWVTNSYVTEHCPPDGSGGGEFDFYWEGTSTYNCVWYAPNTSLSNSGYAYPDKASMPLSEALLYPKSAPDSTLACPLDPEVIRQLAKKLWDKAKGKPGVPDPGVVDEPKTGGDTPRLKELADPPTAPPPTDNAPGPEPSPTPTPTPTDPGETVGDPPTLGDPVAPEIDWWPDLPSISLSFGNPECPTYDMSVPQFGWTATLDAHCPLIDANRAAIGVIMMLMFSVGSILIVLRA